MVGGWAWEEMEFVRADEAGVATMEMAMMVEQFNAATAPVDWAARCYCWSAQIMDGRALYSVRVEE